jgi:hypothetical protein
MFETELHQSQQRVDGAGNEKEARKRALASSILLAQDLFQRINEYIQSRVEKFRRRKAEFGRPVRSDEKPNELVDQTRKGRGYLTGGTIAIAIEVVIASITAGVIAYKATVAVWLSVTIGLLIGALTLGFALVIERGLHAQTDKNGDPHRAIRTLKRYFALPALVTTFLSLMLFVAERLLDGASLLAMAPLLKSAPFIAAASLIVLGASLRTIGDFLMWSREDSQEYQLLMSERVTILNAHNSWVAELNGLSEGSARSAPAVAFSETDSVLADPTNPSTVPTAAAAAAPAQNGKTPPTDPTGSVEATSLPTANILSAAVIASVLGILTSACDSAQAVVTQQPKANSSVIHIVADASGVRNPLAYRAAGDGIMRDLPNIVLDNNVQTLEVLWFGGNGWVPEQKKMLGLPVLMNVSVSQPDLGELGILPSVREASEEKNAKAQTEAQKSAHQQNYDAVNAALEKLSVNDLVPPPPVESYCTDLDGLFGQIDETRANELNIWLVVTDGRQNCQGKAIIRPLLNAQTDKAIVVMIIPGDATAGRDDFERRKKIILDACPWAIVIRHDGRELRGAIAKAAGMVLSTVPSIQERNTADQGQPY